MDSVVSQFLSKGTAVIAVIVVIAGFFIKRIVELLWPKLRPVANELDHKPMYTGKPAMWWNEIGLYALPVLIGLCVGFVNEPFLFGSDIKTTSGRVFYSAVVGWFADFLYTVVQKALYKSTGVQLPLPGVVAVMQQQTTTTVISQDAEGGSEAVNAAVHNAMDNINKNNGS